MTSEKLCERCVSRSKFTVELSCRCYYFLSFIHGSPLLASVRALGTEMSPQGPCPGAHVQSYQRRKGIHQNAEMSAFGWRDGQTLQGHRGVQHFPSRVTRVAQEAVVCNRQSPALSLSMESSVLAPALGPRVSYFLSLSLDSLPRQMIG